MRPTTATAGRAAWRGALLALAAGLGAAGAAEQRSATYTVQATVRVHAPSNAVVASARALAGVSAWQQSAVGRRARSPSYTLDSGFRPATPDFDADGDGLPDPQDPDTDGDGLADAADAQPYDFDGDNLANLIDADDDSDGLADRMEWAFGTRTLKTDTDGDTAGDGEEWVAGTSGTDPADALRLAALSNRPERCALRWQGRAGRRYRLEGRPALAGGPPWETLGTVDVNTSGWVEFLDAGAQPQRFYRLKAALQP